MYNTFSSAARVFALQSTKIFELKVRLPHMFKIIKKNFRITVFFHFLFKNYHRIWRKSCKVNTFLRVARVFQVQFSKFLTRSYVRSRWSKISKNIVDRCFFWFLIFELRLCLTHYQVKNQIWATHPCGQNTWFALICTYFPSYRRLLLEISHRKICKKNPFSQCFAFE